MAAAAIFKITFLAITRPLLHAFAPNLKHRLKMGSHSQIYRQNSHSAKIQPPFWNPLNGNNSTIFEWIWTKLDTDTENKVRDIFYPQNSYPTKSKMAAINCTYLLRIWYISWKQGPRIIFAIKICICKNPRWQKLPFWNELLGGNSAICEQISTKFDTETATEVLDQVLPAKLISQKITDGGSAILKFNLSATTEPLLSH